MALTEIILDAQKAAWDVGVPRRLDVTALPGKATAIVGPRRSGKTTLLHQRMAKLVESGVVREDILYLNFFDDRLRHLWREGAGAVTDAYYALYPQKKNPQKNPGTVHFFFDEIQVAPGWEAFVDRVMRTERCSMHLSGSSARMLSAEIATEMRGRALAWELFPFSFREYLDYLDIDPAAPLSSKRRLLVQHAFERYWETGGFPEVVGLDRALRVKIHQEYWSAMLFRDLVERHDFRQPRAVLDLGHRLLDIVASRYSLNRLTGYLRALGHRVPKHAVAAYLRAFEEAFFLFTVRLYDASLARANTNPKKIYCVDHALVGSVSSGILANTGHLLENVVFMGLRRATPEIYYYKSATGREVDFVAVLPDRSRVLVQVCETLLDPATRRRELAALREAMSALGLDTAKLIVRRGVAPVEEAIDVGVGTVEVVPVWRFLLELA